MLEVQLSVLPYPPFCTKLLQVQLPAITQENEFFGHGIHEDEPAEANVFTGHAEYDAAPEIEYDPGGDKRQIPFL